MTFHVGQKVICIHDFGQFGAKVGIILPKKHQIYTIRAFCPNAVTCTAILLMEIHNSLVIRFKWSRKYGEPSFYTGFFRPLVDLYEVFSISTTAPKQKELQHNGTD